MNPTLLRQVYRQHGIKKKKLRWMKEVPDVDERIRQQELAKMKRALAKAKRDRYRIIYLDETCFTRTTVKGFEWALPGQNLSIE